MVLLVWHSHVVCLKFCLFSFHIISRKYKKSSFSLIYSFRPWYWFDSLWIHTGCVWPYDDVPIMQFFIGNPFYYYLEILFIRRYINTWYIRQLWSDRSLEIRIFGTQMQFIIPRRILDLEGFYPKRPTQVKTVQWDL